MAVELRDPQCQPRAREPRRRQSWRASSIVSVTRNAHDRAVFSCAAAGRPGCGEAARLAGVPCDPVSARQPECRQSEALPGARRRAKLSVAHQGQGRRRFFNGVGRARRRDDRVCVAGAGLCACQGLGEGLAEGAHGQPDGGRRDRRRQYSRGVARVLEAWPDQHAGGWSTTTGRASTASSRISCS